MKIFCTLLALLFVSNIVSAQKLNDASKTPKVEVIKISWKWEFFNPELLKDPFDSIVAPNQINYITNSQLSQSQNLPLEPMPSNANFKEKRRNESSDSYVYKLKIKNTGDQVIKKVFWEYSFSEIGTDLLVARQRFQSFVRDGIKPGETRTLITRSRFPPVSSINATRFNKSLVERINIQSVE